MFSKSKVKGRTGCETSNELAGKPIFGEDGWEKNVNFSGRR